MEIYKDEEGGNEVINNNNTNSNNTNTNTNNQEFLQLISNTNKRPEAVRENVEDEDKQSEKDLEITNNNIQEPMVQKDLENNIINYNNDN